MTLEKDNERLLEQRRRELSKALSDARRWHSNVPDLAASGLSGRVSAAEPVAVTA